LGTNPLRILDSKDPRDVECCQGAPAAADSLSAKSRAHFDRVQAGLAAAGASFVVDGTLVRGFDYYTDTLWEVTAGGLGSQNALGGGGRYDNLVEQLGGRPTPGVGFGSGLERLLIALDAQGVQIPDARKPLVWLISQNDAARAANAALIAELRAADVPSDMDVTGRSMKSQFKLADREKAAWCITVGQSELDNGTVMLKNFATRQEQSLARSAVVEYLKTAIHSA
jgi:histidyl-tRNA synthetase